MIGNCDVPAREPLVMAATQNLDMQISDLKDQLGILLSRLSAVSRSAAPCAVGEKAGKIKESTPLSDMLDGYAARLFAMRADVRDAIDRLEI